MQIGTLSELYQMVSFLVLLSDLYSKFQGHDIQHQIIQKWCKIERYLWQWLYNGRLITFSVSLTGPLSVVSAARHRMSQKRYKIETRIQ